MINWILKLIPNDYKWSVGIKKATWTVAKTGVALLAATKVGKQVPPDQWPLLTDALAALMAGGMKVVHDWARMKWPDVSWL
jgi:hypothetical protein